MKQHILLHDGLDNFLA